MSEAEMKVNLGVLLSEEHEKDSNQHSYFPDKTEILGTLEIYAKLEESDIGNKKLDHLAASVPLNELCAVIWNTPCEREWYTGMTRSIIDEDSLIIKYLEHIDTNSSKKTCRYPQKEDEQISETIQIIPCNVIGAWDMTLRQSRFIVEN